MLSPGRISRPTWCAAWTCYIRVRLDLSWQITNGKADAAPVVVPHGEVMSGIRVTQLAKLKEQLGTTAEMPDYLATVPDKKAADKGRRPRAAKAQLAKKPAAKAVQRTPRPSSPSRTSPRRARCPTRNGTSRRGPSARDGALRGDRRPGRRRPDRGRHGDVEELDQPHPAEGHRPQDRAQLRHEPPVERRDRLHRFGRDLPRTETPARRRRDTDRRDHARPVGIRTRQGAGAGDDAPRDEARRAFPADHRRPEAVAGRQAEEVLRRLGHGTR